jgi:hypothetical protein
MQSPEEKGKQPSAEETGPYQDLPLSETWRALLGLQGAEKPAGEEIVQVEPLASDPWSHLQQAQGMQPVDLQKICLHDLHLSGDDEDVEHALNLMREATGQLPAFKQETREA